MPECRPTGARQAPDWRPTGAVSQVLERLLQRKMIAVEPIDVSKCAAAPCLSAPNPGVRGAPPPGFNTAGWLPPLPAARL